MKTKVEPSIAAIWLASMSAALNLWHVVQIILSALDGLLNLEA